MTDTESHTGPGGGFRILVADDDPQLVKTLCMCLEVEGYTVTGCTDGLSARDRILEWQPHVALLDHFMPGLTGREVCAQVRSLECATRLIVLTSATHIDQKVAGLDAGADDYVGKPFGMEELLARVRAQVRRLEPAPFLLPDRGVLEVDLASSDAKVRTDALARLAEHGGGLTFCVLGDFSLHWQGVELPGVLWNRRKPRSLLKILLAHHDRMVPQEVIIEALWPRMPTAPARHALHVGIQRLRGGLVALESRVTTGDAAYMLSLQAEDKLDLAIFEHTSNSLRLAFGKPASEAEVGALARRLMALYRGDLFAEEPYTEWMLEPRQRIRTAFVDVLHDAAAYLRTRGHLTMASLIGRRLVAVDPTDELRAANLAEDLLDQGDAAGAAAVLKRLERELQDEVGVAPGPRVRALKRRIK